MSKIWTPRQAVKKINNKQVKTVFEIPFWFNTSDGFDKTVERLDQTLTDEREKAVKAIAKFFGGQVVFTK